MAKCEGGNKSFSLLASGPSTALGQQCLSPARFQTGQQTAAGLVARRAVKNVVDDGSIDLLGILGQAFQCCFGWTALSSRVGILFGEMLLHEFEERLLRIRLSRCSLLLSSHGGQDRKTSSRDSARLSQWPL